MSNVFPMLPNPQSANFRTARGVALMFGTWIVVVIAGVVTMARHAAAPGPAILPSNNWPGADLLPRTSDVSTLVMTVHPECPCTRASVNDLEQLMSKCHGQLTALVLFVEPDGFQEDTAARELWQAAAGIPGVNCVIDRNGKISERFNATTSGQVFVYDPSGVLEFSGGITESRGHAGDSDGADAIVAVVSHQQPLTRQTSVFGCSLR